jgi:hypothetical protein
MHLRSRALLIGILSMTALAPGAALARRVPPPPPAQCAVIPNPVSNDVAGQYTVVGSGFAFAQTLDVFVVGPTGATTIFMVSADSAGNFAAIGWAPFLVDDGQWTVSVYQVGDRRMRVLARCSFVVT